MRIVRQDGLPADAPEPLRRWYESVRRGRPAVAVVNAELPGGAVARVVRDPSAETPRLFVVSRQSVDDEVLTLAQFLLRQSEINRPEVTGRRTITVWRDRRYTVEAGDRTESGRFDYTYLRPVGERQQTDALLRLADRRAEVDVAELGRAKLVPAFKRMR